MGKRFTMIFIALSLMSMSQAWAQMLKFDQQLIDAGTMTEDDATNLFVRR